MEFLVMFARRPSVTQCAKRKGDGITFHGFCSCDGDLDPMTFIYELDPYAPKIYRISENKLSTSRLSKVIVWQTNKQTDRHHGNYCYSRFEDGKE